MPYINSDALYKHHKEKFMAAGITDKRFGKLDKAVTEAMQRNVLADEFPGVKAVKDPHLRILMYEDTAENAQAVIDADQRRRALNGRALSA